MSTGVDIRTKTKVALKYLEMRTVYHWAKDRYSSGLVPLEVDLHMRAEKNNPG